MTAAASPTEVGHVEKWQLALDMIDAISAGRAADLPASVGPESAVRSRWTARTCLPSDRAWAVRPWARAALDIVLGAGKPVVVDADALNLIAETKCRAAG